MNVAVIGWGSLIWCRGALEIAGRWRGDGPRLPVEFARRSKWGRGARLTLVIHPEFDDQQTYWAISTFTILEEARRNLRERERASMNHVHSTSRGESVDVREPIKTRVRAWLEDHLDVDAAIWTGLPRTIEGPKETVVHQAVEYLSSLDPDGPEYQEAREYIVKAPPQIQTLVRLKMRGQGWADEELSSDLFEEPKR